MNMVPDLSRRRRGLVGLATLSTLVALGATLLGGCSIMMDNGTHLAFALEHAAQDLRTSGEHESVFRYEPLTGIDQSYEIRLSPSRSTTPPYGGYVIVTGKNGGGTGFQDRSVYIARRFEISKSGAAAQITLRKNGERIEVVDVE